MYSPRQRDVRERRLHERGDARHLIDPVVAMEADDGGEYEPSPAWSVRLGTRASAA